MLRWMLAVVLGLVALAVEAAEPTRLGVVDLRFVVMESKVGRANKAELDKLVKAKQEQLQKEEGKLKAMQEKFEKDQLTLTDAQKKERQREFQEKLQALQKLGGDAQRELGQKDQDFTRKVVGDVRAVVAEIAKEQKLALVIEKGEMSVLYAEDGLDLTARVLERYNSRN